MYLASRSPRRLELLRAIGAQVQVVGSAIDERPGPNESPTVLVERLAREKGEAAARLLPPDAAAGIVVAADTEVLLDGRVLGKPGDAAEARAMLRALAGREHEVWTAVWLARSDVPRHTSGVARTRVVFRDYDDAFARAYAATGEPLDKAGGYGIQGRGALLAERIDGSWSNVVGFPLEQLPGWIAELGLALDDVLDWAVSAR